jgi:hypothetical protein
LLGGKQQGEGRKKDVFRRKTHHRSENGVGV